MRFLATLIGGLLGVLPGLLLIALGQLVTGGGDGMIDFGMGGVALMVVGFGVGAVLGWRNHAWVSTHLILSVFGGLASIVAIVTIWIAVGGPPDPIASSDNCEDVYHLLGATGDQGVILDLPQLSREEIERLEQKLPQLEDDSDAEVCQRLRDDLEAQR